MSHSCFDTLRHGDVLQQARTVQYSNLAWLLHEDRVDACTRDGCLLHTKPSLEDFESPCRGAAVRGAESIPAGARV
jgi:hypothetical protein